MACYDCEDCSLHHENGGRCKRFEYNCPFDLYMSLNDYPVEAAKIHSLLDEIKFAEKKIQEITDTIHVYGIIALDNLHWAIERLDDDIAPATEWMGIINEEE